MKYTVSHNWSEESLEAKARWFQSLSMSERMEHLCAFTEMIVSINPAIVEQRHAQSLTGRIQVLSRS
ncbi:MAG: hypothetical protein GY801_10300 [bacterium]|nr:hypothetical protein [bacterium]